MRLTQPLRTYIQCLQSSGKTNNGMHMALYALPFQLALDIHVRVAGLGL